MGIAAVIPQYFISIIWNQFNGNTWRNWMYKMFNCHVDIRISNALWCCPVPHGWCGRIFSALKTCGSPCGDEIESENTRLSLRPTQGRGGVEVIYSQFEAPLGGENRSLRFLCQCSRSLLCSLSLSLSLSLTLSLSLSLSRSLLSLEIPLEIGFRLCVGLGALGLFLLAGSPQAVNCQNQTGPPSRVATSRVSSFGTIRRHGSTMGLNILPLNPSFLVLHPTM